MNDPVPRMPDIPPVTAQPLPETSLDVVRRVLAPAAGRSTEMVAVGRGEPSFLLPADRRMAAAICVSYNGLRSPRRRMERRAAAAALRAGAGSPLLESVSLDGALQLDEESAGSLLEALSERLDTELVAGVGLGQLDAYWKPVLQLFDTSSNPVAYAKIGWNSLTSALVRNEAAALAALGPLDCGVTIPDLLDSFEWGGLDVTVTSPLPRRSKRMAATSPPPPPGAMETVDGPEVSAPLAGTQWWSEVTDRVEGIVGPDGNDLGPLFEFALSSGGNDTVRLGRQHGDWVTWNLATDPDAPESRGSLVAWDWEYSRPDSPLGLDRMHGVYQGARLLGGLDDSAAFARAHRAKPPVMRVAHAAMVASRRCWAASLGAPETDGGSELSAALEILESVGTAAISAGGET